MAGFPLVGGGGVSPTTRKIGLSHHVSLMFCLQNVDFVLFMQSLSILPKFPPLPTGRPHLGNPVCISNTGSCGSNDFLSGSSTFHLILYLYLTYPVMSLSIRKGLFSTHVNFFEKLTFLTV